MIKMCSGNLHLYRHFCIDSWHDASCQMHCRGREPVANVPGKQRQEETRSASKQIGRSYSHRKSPIKERAKGRETK